MVDRTVITKGGTGRGELEHYFRELTAAVETTVDTGKAICVLRGQLPVRWRGKADRYVREELIRGIRYEWNRQDHAQLQLNTAGKSEGLYIWATRPREGESMKSRPESFSHRILDILAASRRPLHLMEIQRHLRAAGHPADYNRVTQGAAYLVKLGKAERTTTGTYRAPG
ncbi:MAG: hypothetical protein ACRENJ_02060 [Candidatus Eiseniibacteriota bacterium]